MKKWAVLAVLLPFSSANAESAGPMFSFLTGNDLYGYCAAGDIINTQRCWAYVEGAVDALAYVSASQKLHAFCLPEPAGAVNGQQLADVVTQYLREDPAGRSFGAASLVYGALTKFFPCKPAG